MLSYEVKDGENDSYIAECINVANKIQDNDSKFGTLSLVTSPIELQPKVNSHL